METKITIPYQEIKNIAEFNWAHYSKDFPYHLDIKEIDKAFPELENMEIFQPAINRGSHYQLCIKPLDNRFTWMSRWMSQDITKKQFKFLQDKYNLK